MARVLRRTVITGGVTYPPGTAETAELAKKITNPKAWEGEPDPEPASAPRKRTARSAQKPANPAASTDSTPGAGETPQEPPRGGEGATEEAWRAYAVGLDLEVPEGAGRDDIIALVDAHAASGSGSEK